MVGLNIPIHLEGGDSTSRASPGVVSASRLRNRNGSDAALRKPLRKKNSRQKLRTFNIEIQLEGGRDDRCPGARVGFDKNRQVRGIRTH